MRQFIVFCIVGGAAAISHFGIAAALNTVIPLQISNLIGFVVGFFISFWGHSIVTFGSPPAVSSLVKYGGLACFNYIFSSVFLYYAASVFGVNETLALAMVVLAIPVFNFFVGKILIFR